MTTNQKPTSPLFGWVAAGADLVSDQLDQVTGMVSKQLDATHALFEELQQRGEPVDEQIRQTLSPSSVFSSMQSLVMANPLFSLLSGNKKASVREQQLAALSVKVDLLVEQVALLAASKAQAQAASASAKKTAPKATTKTAAEKATGSTTTSTKSTTSSTASKTTPARKTASKPATRKRSTTSSKRSATTSGKTTPSSAKKAD